LNKLSTKLAFWFLVAMLIVEVFLFYFLHANIVESRIEDELASLKLRGNSHRDILESSYNKETLDHVSLMEAKAETEVVVADPQQKIIVSSSATDSTEKKILSKKLSGIPREGKIIEDNWRKEKYIATVTPITINHHEQGYVYMFRSTGQVQNLISRLNDHFLIAGIVTFALLMITIVFLTRALTTPLVRMKNATEKLSKGDYSVKLPNLGSDELGELGNSIKTLTKELKHLKDERNEFLSSISHELRTPLTYIKGYADVARRRTHNDSDRLRYLDIIYEESEKLTGMLKNLFDLARIDRNTFAIHKQKVELCG
jgi:signal transduction histidine kinase